MARLTVFGYGWSALARHSLSGARSDVCLEEMSPHSRIGACQMPTDYDFRRLDRLAS